MFQRILKDDSEIIVFERHVSDLFFSNVAISDIEIMGTWPMVEQVLPSLFGLVSSEDRPVIACFGVTADSPRLKGADWIEGNLSDFGQSRDIVLGSRAAEFLGVKLGDTAPLGHDSFPVGGIIRTENGFEDGGVFMPLAQAQEFFHKDGVASIASVSLFDDNLREAFIAKVKEGFPDLTALETEEFGNSYSQFRIIEATAWAVGGSAFLLGGLSVANTMIMSVFGRIREIAILRVNGFSPTQIASLIFGESSVITFFGVALGIGVGFGTMLVLQRVPLFQGYVDTQLHGSVLGVVVALAFVTGIGGALYPALYAMRIHPAEALRFE